MDLYIICLMGLFALFNYVKAQKLTNYTVDLPDPSGTGGLGFTDVDGSDDYGGSHIVLTGGQSISFSFEGVAISLITLSRVPTPLICYVWIDEKEPFLVNMTQSQVSQTELAVFWSGTGLSNEKHKLVVSGDTTNHCYIDRYIYTSQGGTPVPSPSNPPPTVLALAVTASIICTLLLLALLFILVRGRRKENPQVTLVPFADASDTPKPEKDRKGISPPRSFVWPVMTKSPLHITTGGSVSVEPLAVGQSGDIEAQPVVDHNPVSNERNTAPSNANAKPGRHISYPSQLPAVKSGVSSPPARRRWTEQLLGNSRQFPPPGLLPMANHSRVEESESPPSYFPSQLSARPFIGPPRAP